MREAEAQQIQQNEEVVKNSFASQSRHRTFGFPYQKEGFGNDWLINFLNDRLCVASSTATQKVSPSANLSI